MATLNDGRGSEYVTGLWEWAGVAANEQARRHEWGGDFTAEEREGGVENVITGLKRTFEDEEESEEDEEGDDKMPDVKASEKNLPEEVDGKPLPMDDVLRFLVKGEEPKR